MRRQTERHQINLINQRNNIIKFLIVLKEEKEKEKEQVQQRVTRKTKISLNRFPLLK